MLKGFKPLEGQQTLFLASPATELFYGGLPGGGKSEGGVMDAAGLSFDPPQFKNPMYWGKLFRRQESQLDQLIAYCRRHYPHLGLKESDGGKRWTHPDYGKIELYHMNNENDFLKHQGHEVTYILFDELPQFSEEQYGGIMPWNRAPVNSGLTPFIRATGNPIGPGVPWVRDRFILPLKANAIHKIRYAYEGKEYITTRQFIPSSFRDNKYIGDEYVGGLLNMPNPQVRKALLNPDPVAAWSVVMGSFFEQFSNITHVIPRSEEKHIREYLRNTPTTRMEGIDWGFRSPFATLWAQEDTEGDVYVTDTHYVAGQRLEYHCNAIHRIRERLGWEKNGRKITGFKTVADPSIWNQNTTVLQSDKTIAQELNKRGIQALPANNDIIIGLSAVHELMFTDGVIPPRLHIFESCVPLIDELVKAIVSDANIERIKEGCPDHLLDCLRYVAMYLKEARPEKTLPERHKMSWDAIMKNNPEEMPKFPYSRGRAA